MILTTVVLKGQDPFEKYPAIPFKEYKDWRLYDKSVKEKKVHHTLTIPDFFENKDSLTIQLTSFVDNWDSSYVRIYRNSNQIQKLFEPMGFSQTNIFEPIRVADINGDNLMDLKILIPYMGNGIAALNDACKKANSKSFMDCTPGQRHDFLVSLEKEAKDFNQKRNEENKSNREANEKANSTLPWKDQKEFQAAPSHYFTMMKQLTLLGFFTSKTGMTETLRHIAIPGRYDGAIPYAKGDKAWAE